METPKYRIWAEGSLIVPQERTRCASGLDKLKFHSPSNTSRRRGGLLFSKSIYQWTPEKLSLLRDSLRGGHAWCNVLGADPLAVEFFLELVRRTQVPEVAILGVDELDEVTRARSSLDSAGVWRAPGVPVVAIQSLDHWQEGNVPESYQAEFRGLQVPGGEQIECMGGLPNIVEKSHNYRGCMTLLDGKTKVTFWFVVASKSILVSRTHISCGQYPLARELFDCSTVFVVTLHRHWNILWGLSGLAHSRKYSNDAY
eukprot:jgi/Botrbrau1/20481/Bobra.145_2s0041.1